MDSRASFADYDGVIVSFAYTRSSTSSCLYQVISILLFIRGHQRLLFIPGHQRPFCLYQVIQRFLVYTGEVSYSHQWPGCDGRFLGRHNADERFLGRLHE